MTLLLCKPLNGDHEKAPTYEEGKAPPPPLYWTGSEWSDDRDKAKVYDTRDEALKVHATCKGQSPDPERYRTPVAVTKG